jgi:acyl transferase domain-containing protein
MSKLNDDIAIIGMACIYPGAPDLETFWQNILNKVDAVSEPSEHLGFDESFDPESTANDRIYCKKGGFIEAYAEFNPFDFGIMPDSVDGSNVEQFLALRVAREALSDAGYLDRPFNRKQTGVILGHGFMPERGHLTLHQHGLIVDQTLKILNQLLPDLTSEALRLLKQELKEGLPPLNADTCPGLVSNLLTGRIANRLDLYGPNYAVDAACASSLISVDLGVQELRSKRCDMILVGGVQASTSPLVFLMFCLLGALSRHGQIRPFDKNADGTLLGEGLGMMVIKRREDAEKDGDSE